MTRSRRSNQALRLSLVATFVGATFATIGCTSRLPGPTECEAMAVRLIGEPPEAIRSSPAKSRFLAIVTHGCLTTPFDHQAVRCVGETRALRRCLDELTWRLPDRKDSVHRFMTRALEK